MADLKLVRSRAVFVALTPLAVFAFLVTAGLGLDAAGLVDDIEASPVPTAVRDSTEPTPVSTPAAASPSPVDTPRATLSASREPTRTPTGTPTPTPIPNPAETAAAGTALAATQVLAVKGRAPKTGYDRDQFGQRWADTDRNGCDQRNDVLRRDLADFATRAGTKGCVVLSGNLKDPFTGKTIKFKRGNKTSNAVHIDHTVALSDAWQKGAQQWDADKREEFANDFLNLVAVDGPTNSAKGDGDTATWLPPNKKYRCDYVARQVSVKKEYGLWVTQAELDAMVRVLSTCPEMTVLTARRAAPPERDSSTDKKATKPKPKPTKTQPPEPQPEPEPDNTYYKNCDAVRAAGKDPIHRGEPGYAPHLDRDGDGIGCE